MKICILDYGSGNVKSVYNMVKMITSNVEISNKTKSIKEATHIILPGVGAFGSAIRKINKHIPLAILEYEVKKLNKPFLGICVGMQVLADKGYEFGEHKGLGWIPGTVSRLNSKNLPLPHVGWNDLKILRKSKLTKNIGLHPDFYFLHSFVLHEKKLENVLATTDYGEKFNSIINKKNIFGVQFHPEKSQKVGMMLFKNFFNI